MVRSCDAFLCCFSCCFLCCFLPTMFAVSGYSKWLAVNAVARDGLIDELGDARPEILLGKKIL